MSLANLRSRIDRTEITEGEGGSASSFLGASVREEKYEGLFSTPACGVLSPGKLEPKRRIEHFFNKMGGNCSHGLFCVSVKKTT